MQFGRVPSVDAIDFTFPENHPGTDKVLGGSKSERPEVYVGAPVWSDPGFPGKLYPAGAKEKEFVRHYGKQFNCIELNTTHYSVPEPSVVRRWVDAVPDHFRFCPKIHQSISHSVKLDECATELQAFHERISEFGSKLGPCFMQLPPTFGTPQLKRLMRFLDQSVVRDLAVELRHESWFTDAASLSTLCNYLYKNNLSLVMTDVAGRRDVLHQRLTTTTAFVRFVANNLHPSDFRRMDDWVARISHWIDHGLQRLFFFIHTPDKSFTPELAMYFIGKLNSANNLNVAAPQIYTPIKDDDLFA
jgi:uncharacterized protein YecE (DUF72 family)